VQVKIFGKRDFLFSIITLNGISNKTSRGTKSLPWAMPRWGKGKKLFEEPQPIANVLPEDATLCTATFDGDIPF